MFSSCQLLALIVLAVVALASGKIHEAESSQDESHNSAQGTALFQSGRTVVHGMPGVRPHSFDDFADLADDLDSDILQEDLPSSTSAALPVELAHDIEDVLIGRGPTRSEERKLFPRLLSAPLLSAVFKMCHYVDFSAVFQDVFLLVLGIVGYSLWRGSLLPRGAANAPLATNLDTDELVQAMYTDNKQHLQRLLEERSPDASEEVWGCTALHVAAHCNGVHAAEALLLRGANPNMKDTWDETPLHFAARSGSLQVCKLLVTYGADLTAINARDWTPLVVAAEAGREDVCEFLLSCGAGVEGLSDAELPPLLSSLLVRRMFQTNKLEQDTSAAKVKSA